MAATDTGANFDIGRAIQRTTALIGRNFVQFSILSLILAGAPYLVLLVILPMVVLASASGDATMITVAVVAVVVVYLLGALLLQAALTRASVDDLSGKPVAIGAALSAGFGALLPLFGLLLVFIALFVVGVIIFGIFSGILGFAAGPAPLFLLAIAFFVAVVFLLLRWVVASPVIVIEKPGVIASLRRSSALTENHRWAILGLLVLYIIFVVIVQIVFALAVPGAAEAMAGTAAQAAPLLVLVVLVMMQAFTTLIVTVGIAAVYFELRQIKEGVGVDELSQVFA